jgi:hypothetical protein
MRRFRLLAAVCLILLFFSCSDNPPQMNGIEWQVILFHNKLLNATYQKLSLYVSASDKDGAKDLAFLHVINDDQEIYWSVPAEKWEKAVIRNNEWVGSSGFAMPDGQSLPTGSYRVVLEDLSGKKVESQIYIKKANVETSNARFPVPRREGSRILVEGNFVSPELWVYDSNDQFLARLPLPKKSMEISAIISRNQERLAGGFTYYVYAKQPDVYFGVLDGPFYYAP